MNKNIENNTTSKCRKNIDILSKKSNASQEKKSQRSKQQQQKMGQSDSRLPLEEGKSGGEKSIIDVIENGDDEDTQPEWVPEDENEFDDAESGSVAGSDSSPSSGFASCAVSADDDDEQHSTTRDHSGSMGRPPRHGSRHRRKRSKTKRKHGQIPDYRRRNLPRASNPREKPPAIEELIRLFPWDKSLKQYAATFAVKQPGTTVAIVKPKPRSATSAQKKTAAYRERVKNTAPPWAAKPPSEMKSREKGTISESKKSTEREPTKSRKKPQSNKPKSANPKRSK